jgi:multidrug efflux pump subunit AcrA (membrane-fusion protein)
MKMTMKKLAWIPVVIALSMLTGCFPTEENPVTPPIRTPGEQATYQTYTVKKGDVVNQLTNVTGSMNNPLSYDCFFTMKDLRFKEYNVKSGDQVQAGTIVASADTTIIENGIKESQYLLKGYNLDMDKLKNTGGSIYDIERLQLDIDYQNGLLQTYQDALNNSTISATGSGMVTFLDTTLKSGDIITPNKTLVLISDVSKAYIDLPISDPKNVPLFKVGMPVTIRQNNKEYPGEVIMTPEALPAGSTANPPKARIIFLQYPTDGSFVNTGLTVSIVFEKHVNVVFVPVNMVTTNADTKVSTVQVLDGENKVQRVVTLGLVSSQYAEILSGLAEGDKVVVNNN